MRSHLGFVFLSAVFATAAVAACGGNQAATSEGTGAGTTTTGSTHSTSTGSSTTGSTASSGPTAGSSSSSATTGSTTSGGGAGGSPALTPAPQVVNASKGPVLTAPRIQLIAYSEDTTVPDVEAFLTELTKTQTWSQQTSEYGVGPLTILPTILISGTPPATLNDNGDPSPLEMTLASNISGANPPWGEADASTVYTFLLPQGTQVDSDGLCCDANSGYYGYHYEAPVGSSSVPYAVICNCPSLDPPPLTQLQYVTTTVSHELAEACTNPFVASMPAFGQTDQDDAIWEVGTFGGEVADMCQNNADANYVPPGSTYMVQRSWSNAAAKAGTNPCVPVPATGPYFNAYPVLADMITIGGSAFGSNSFTTMGVKIPVGQTKTIDVVLHSDGTTSGPWSLSVTDLSEYIGDTASTKVSLDKTSGNDGDVVHLTIKVLSADASIGGEGFVLSSTLGTQNNLWYAAVGQ